MKRLLLLALLSLSLVGCRVSVSTTPEAVSTEPGTPEQRTQALQAAQSIVTRMDKGEFDAVWEQSSDLLKDATYKVVFVKALAATRGSLKRATSRGEPRIGFSTRIDPNAPEGEYSVVEVDRIDGATTVTEKLVLAREGRQWKLAGYFVNSKRKFGG